MIRVTALSLYFFCLVCLVACGSPATLQQTVAQHPGSKVAVVSIAANNFGGSLQGWNSASTSDLMTSRVAKMLSAAERQLGTKWKVIPADGFVGKKSFQKHKGASFEVGLAKLPNGTLPVFAADRDQLIKAQLEPAQAQALAAVTGADLLVVIYSEWAVATGRFVPTAKALTKNVVSIYSAAGEQVFHGRRDQMGTKSLGAFGRVSVTDETIDQWVGSYEVAITSLLQ
jgi:hypothetical protein